MNDLQLPEHLSILIDRASFFSELTLWLFLVVAAGVGVLAVFLYRRKAVYVSSILLLFFGITSDGPIYQHYMSQMCHSTAEWRMINNKSTDEEMAEARNLFEKSVALGIVRWGGTLRIWELKPPGSSARAFAIASYQPRFTRTMSRWWRGVYFFDTLSSSCTLISKPESL